MFNTDGANVSYEKGASVSQADTVRDYSADEAFAWYLDRQEELAYASDNPDE